ncbi:hypothetical protein BU17DRAFT_95491 [Hysterangium stoloniferum]|nr:hypothetical protein BU17DRAFT_95491 [Hysterangium stoloniferum]
MHSVFSDLSGQNSFASSSRNTVVNDTLPAGVSPDNFMFGYMYFKDGPMSPSPGNCLDQNMFRTDVPIAADYPSELYNPQSPSAAGPSCQILDAGPLGRALKRRPDSSDPQASVFVEQQVVRRIGKSPPLKLWLEQALYRLELQLLKAKLRRKQESEGTAFHPVLQSTGQKREPNSVSHLVNQKGSPCDTEWLDADKFLQHIQNEHLPRKDKNAGKQLSKDDTFVTQNLPCKSDYASQANIVRHLRTDHGLREYNYVKSGVLDLENTIVLKDPQVLVGEFRCLVSSCSARWGTLTRYDVDYPRHAKVHENELNEWTAAEGKAKQMQTDENE